MFKSIFVQQRKTSLSITDGEDEKDYTPIGATRSCKGKGYSVNYDVGYFLLCVRFSEVRELVNILRPNLFTIRRLFLSLQRKNNSYYCRSKEGEDAFYVCDGNTRINISKGLLGMNNP